MIELKPIFSQKLSNLFIILSAFKQTLMQSKKLFLGNKTNFSCNCQTNSLIIYKTTIATEKLNTNALMSFISFCLMPSISSCNLHNFNFRLVLQHSVT